MAGQFENVHISDDREVIQEEVIGFKSHMINEGPIFEAHMGAALRFSAPRPIQAENAFGWNFRNQNDKRTRIQMIELPLVSVSQNIFVEM